MRTIPLRGKIARGRVALVDDENYELIRQYRWFVYEKPPKGTGRGSGPYAWASFYVGGRTSNIFMHCLIMGITGVDHIDHNGLNNQKHNLRPATNSQNGANQRPQQGRTSEYKGVYWAKREKAWIAAIKISGKPRNLGQFCSELEAAYAYDAAARETFGEFACPNFPDGPTQAMRDEWQAERAAHDALIAAGAAERTRARVAAQKEWRERLADETRTCQECGRKYQSRSTRSFYCSKACGWSGWNRRRMERELEDRLF